MPPNLFRRVSKYRATGTLDPRENRLTEVTAAVMERVPGLITLVGDVLSRGVVSTISSEVGEAPDPYETVSTQVLVDGRYVDLVITRTTPDGDVRTTYVEIKHGSGEHGDQVDAYLASAAERHQVGVALLVPQRDVPLVHHRSELAPVTSWQTLATAIRGWSKVRAPSGVERWLLDEYLQYLREEDLMDPEALTTSHALALAEIGAAEGAMRAICARADTVIADRFGVRGEHLKHPGAGRAPKHGLDYWAHYSRREPAEPWTPGWLEWGLRDLGGAEYADDLIDYEDILFCAGASFGSGDKPEGSDHGRAWLTSLQAAHTQGEPFLTFWHGGFYRVMRVLRPSSLLLHRSIADQGDAVGNWAAAAFEALWKAGPPSAG